MYIFGNILNKNVIQETQKNPDYIKSRSNKLYSIKTRLFIKVYNLCFLDDDYTHFLMQIFDVIGYLNFKQRYIYISMNKYADF